MDKIPLNVFKERVKKAQELMIKAGVQAMQITSRENYYYFSGDIRNVARILIPQDSEPIIIVFEEEAEFAGENTWIKDIRSWNSPQELMATFLGALKDLNLKDKVVGFDVHSVPGFLLHKFQKLNPDIKLVENDEIAMQLRYFKDKYELERMKYASEVAMIGMEAAVDAVRPGVMETEIAAEAEYVMRKAGAERFGASTFVDSGPNSLCLHGAATTRKIRTGEIVIIDLHPVVGEYSSDLARTTFCGEPSNQQKTALDTYRISQEETFNKIKPGIKVLDVTNHFKEAASKLPYGADWIPAATHGVGLEFEEWPHPSHYPQHLQLELKPGMTISLGHSLLPVRELGAGFRIEDVVHITETGSEYLTHYPR